MKSDETEIDFKSILILIIIIVCLGLLVVYSFDWYNHSIDCGDLEYRFLGYDTISCCKYDEKMELRIGNNNYPYWYNNKILVYCDVYNQTTKEIIEVVRE